MKASSNLGEDPNSVLEDNVTAYRLLDALPPVLRRLIAYAPYDYAVAPWYSEWRALRASATDQEIAHHFARQMAADRRYDALRLYGPSHPQARA